MSTASVIERGEMVRVRSLPLGGGGLSRALQGGSTPASWMAERPGDIASWRARVAAVANATHRHDWLTTLAPAFAATGPAAERLARAASGGVVVTTGQQPGLFGGPMYTFSKAISALTMADALETELGVPVAPVFWAASDDADWREASTTYVIGSAGLEELALHGPPTDGIAMADVALGDTREALDRLRLAAGSAAHRDVLDLIEAAYVPHATIGAAYVQLLRGLLEPLGVAVLDAAHPALRLAADPVLRRALTQSHTIDESLRARSAAIRASGYDPQVEEVAGLSLVFRTVQTYGGRRRERVPISDAPRVVREAEPGTLGANVVLRPVLERALLPTVAYLAGPGEFAYFAQVGAVAESMSADVPLAIPRWSGMIVEPRLERLLERLNVEAAELVDPFAAEGKLARSVMDDAVSDSLERLRVALETQMRALRDAIQSADALVPTHVVDGVHRDIGQRIDRLERRLVAAVKVRERDLIREIAIARAAFAPLRTSPERVLNLIPVLARYGPGVLTALRAEAAQHAQLLVVGTPASA